MLNQDFIFLHLTKNADVRVTEIAAIRCKENVVRAAFSTPVHNHAFKDAADFLKSAILNPKFGNNYLVISYDAEIDRAVLKRENERINIEKEIFYGRAWVDVRQLTWPFVFSELLPDQSTISVCRYLEVEPKFDDAEDACTTLMRIFMVLMQRYRTALIGENVMTDMGGETLKGLRRMIGF